MPVQFTIPSSTQAARVESSAVVFARHDPVLCSLPGMFRVVGEKVPEQVRGSLKLKARHGPLTVELHNSCLLNGLDLAVLQALVALAPVGSTVHSAEQDCLTPVEQGLVKGLEAPAVPATADSPEYVPQKVVEDVQHLDFSISALLELIGWPLCGENRALVQACLQRLASCVLLIYPTTTPKVYQRFHLLSHISTRVLQDRWCRTHVALNPRLSSIVLGEEVRHTRIALAETRQLGKNQAARILHQRLCAWINEHSERTVTLATLVSYLYPDDAESHALSKQLKALDRKRARESPEQKKTRQLLEVQKALNVLDRLPGWLVYLDSYSPYCSDHTKRAREDEGEAEVCNSASEKQRLKAWADVMATLIHVCRGSDRPAHPGASRVRHLLPTNGINRSRIRFGTAG